MHAEQIAFPFRTRKPRRSNSPSADLIGRCYIEGHATITVVSICHGDDKRVMVERDLDGRAWSMPAWLMRLNLSGKEARGVRDRVRSPTVREGGLREIALPDGRASDS